MPIADHYEQLGVPSYASRDEIRVAYRKLARRYHPDTKGDASAVRMAQINEAWRVLSDPGRRAVYDARLFASAAPRSSMANRSSPSRHASGHRYRTATATEHEEQAFAPPATPARFPWQLMVGLASVGIAFVLVNAALTKPGREPVPDNLMEIGSCVDILDNGDAKEVLCSGANDGVVADLRPVNSICPLGTELHRDRQGMGNICIHLGGG